MHDITDLKHSRRKELKRGRKAAAAVKINEMEGNNELILKRELTFLCQNVLLPSP